MKELPSKNILLVEDDLKLSEMVKMRLEHEGYQVAHAIDGEAGRTMIQDKTYDLIITDIMMPRLDGLTLITLLRQNFQHIPILILSAKGQVSERVEGLRSGADDYLTKPFSFDELLARIESLLRRCSANSDSSLLNVANLRVDLLSGKVHRGDTEIELQPQEYSLLVYLMSKNGRSVTRTAILQDVWKYNADPLTNVVESRICRLRRKIDDGFSPKLIQTIRGQGYACAEKK